MQGWKCLNKSSYNRKHLLVPQKEHGYCEGKQHIRRTRWRIASFDTSIFFWQNLKASQKWPITATMIAELKRAFQSKQARERVALRLKKTGNVH